MSYFWSSKASPYHGLVNQGSTCYLNSVLQVLFMTEDFREAVQRHMDVTPHTECIDRDLADLFKELGKRTSYTYKITRTLGIETVYKQQDAAEYLEKILQRTSPEAAQIFRGLLTHKTTCCVCRTDSPSDGPFWFLPLALVDDGGDYSVLDGIKNYFKVTELSGNNQMYCDKCDDKSDATMGCVIKTHPEVLMLLLKRFEFDYRYMTYVKIDCMVDVPRILHIPENETYELYAAVDHYGDLRGGHYVATIKPQKGEQWYSFNDTQVTKCDYQRFQLDDLEKSSSAYLLFYRRIDPDAADAQIPAPGGLPAASSQICEDNDSSPPLIDLGRQWNDLWSGRYWNPEKEVVYPRTVCEDMQGGTKNVRQNTYEDQKKPVPVDGHRHEKRGKTGRVDDGNIGRGTFEESQQKARPGHHQDLTESRGSSVDDGNHSMRYGVSGRREPLGKIRRREDDGAGRSGRGAENLDCGTFKQSGRHEDLMEIRGSSRPGGLDDGRQNMYGNKGRGKTGRDEERVDDGNQSMSNNDQRYNQETSGRSDGAGRSGKGAENGGGQRGQSTIEGSQTKTRTGHHKDLMAGGNYAKQQEEMEQMKKDEEGGTMYAKEEQKTSGSSGKGGFGDSRQNMHGDQERGKTGRYEQSVDDGNQNKSKNDWRYNRETSGRSDGAGMSGRSAENFGHSPLDGSQPKTRTGHHEDLMAGGNYAKQQEEMEQTKTDEERGTMYVKEQELECRGSSRPGGFGDGRQNMHGDQKRGKTGQYEQSVDDGNQNKSNNVQKHYRETTLDGAGMSGRGAENFGHSPLDGSQPKTRIGHHKDLMAGGNYAKQQEETFTGGQRSSSKMKKDKERRVKDKELESLEIRGSSRQGRFAHISQNTYEDQERGKTGQYEQSVDDGNQNKSNNVQRHNQETSGRSDGAGRSGRGAENFDHGHFEESQAKGRHKDPMTGGNYTSRKGGLDNIGRRDANLSKSLEVKITEEETVGGVKTSSETTITTVEAVKKISRIKKWMNRNKRNVEPRPDTSSIMSEVKHLTLSDSPGGDDSDANGKKRNESRAQAVERKTTKGKRHKSPKRRIKTSTTKNPFGCLKIKDKKKRTKSVGCWGFLKKYKRNRGAVTSESD